MKKLVLILVTYALILSTATVSIYASESIDVDTVIDEVINVSEVYKEGGITSGQLLELMAITQEKKSIKNSYNLRKTKLFNPLDYNLDIPKTKDGDLYDGNPPYSDTEQKNRVQFISNVLWNEYSDDKYDKSLYFTYLYTSHYIENINYDRTASDEKNFGHPVYANIIVENDIDAFNQFYNINAGSAVVNSFKSFIEGIQNLKNSDLTTAIVKETVGSITSLASDQMSKYLNTLNTLGIVDTTDVAATSLELFNAYKVALNNGAQTPQELIDNIYSQLGGGLSGVLINQYISTVGYIANAPVVAVSVISPIMAGVCYYVDTLSNIIPMLSLAKLYYSYQVRKADRFAVFVGLRPRP